LGGDGSFEIWGIVGFGSLRVCPEINKIDKSLTNLIKMRNEKTQISKIRNKKGEITTNTKEIQEIIRDYFKSLYSNKLENLKKWTNF
jgi:chorismate mutase